MRLNITVNTILPDTLSPVDSAGQPESGGKTAIYYLIIILAAQKPVA